MSWEEYVELGEFRGEYIDGELVIMPWPTLPHQQVMMSLVILIRQALPPGEHAIQHWGWKPADDEFIPDVMVFETLVDEERLTDVPYLVVEILSSDLARDVLRKFAKYASVGLERLWMVDLEGPVITEYRLDGATYREVGRHGPGIVVDLDIGPTTITVDPANLLN